MQKAGFFDELTHPKCHIIAALLFHIDCERHTQRLILSLVKHRSLKMHTFKAIKSQEGPRMRRLCGPNTVRSPLNNHVWVLHLHTEVVTICRREQDGLFFIIFSGACFGNSSFFAVYSKLEIAHLSIDLYQSIYIYLSIYTHTHTYTHNHFCVSICFDSWDCI